MPSSIADGFAKPPKRHHTLPRIFRKSSRPSSPVADSRQAPIEKSAPVVDAVPSMPPLAFGAPLENAPNVNGSKAETDPESPVSVFAENPHVVHQAQVMPPMPESPPRSAHASVHDQDQEQAADSYDLNPPPPAVSNHSVETLALRLFSTDHLNLILRDPTHHQRFVAFLSQYKPAMLPKLKEYLETQKAVAAVEYANAVAEQLQMTTRRQPYTVATLDMKFSEEAYPVVQDLVIEALPAYVTHRLTRIVTDTLVKEITGQGTPLMREMIPALAEVYCVTDPASIDNPIVYASQEFYNTTQYDMEYVIGRNCRFLSGSRTSHRCIKRLVDALAAGQEITETILNYRKDGTPFLNLLLIAPLYDNKGLVRYFLGCQIDVSSLIENGRGIESFEQLLSRDRADSRYGGRHERKATEVLTELGAMLTEEESSSLRSQSIRFASTSGRATPPQRQGRMILGVDDDEAERKMWPLASLGPSGRLPGVYQNYLLVRPYPSLRITFTSPALRIPGLLQTKFLDRVQGPMHVREGILDAFAHGTSVTAKITWLSHAPESNDVSRSQGHGKPRWIHCTPLLGSDGKVGVWMIVMVEHEEVTGSLHRDDDARAASREGNYPKSPRGAADASRFTGNKLYQDYLRREGRSDVSGVSSRNGSTARDGPAVEQFKDF